MFVVWVAQTDVSSHFLYSEFH